MQEVAILQLFYLPLPANRLDRHSQRARKVVTIGISAHSDRPDLWRAASSPLEEVDLTALQVAFLLVLTMTGLVAGRRRH